MITSCDNFDLCAHNTFGMAVRCRRFVEYDSAEDIPALLASLPEGEPWMQIGEGSNLLFLSDYPGSVLHSRVCHVREERRDGTEVLLRAGAGVNMDTLARETAAEGLWGLELLAGIPGEVGSAAVQNVGAYGREAADVIREVTVYDTAECCFKTLGRDECRYGYRDSIFKHPEVKGRYIVTDVLFGLSTTGPSHFRDRMLEERFGGREGVNPLDVALAVVGIRNSKLPDPKDVPSAGSFFKNPVVSTEVAERLRAEYPDIPAYDAEGGVKIPAAWLIDRCGWKGKKLGRAAVWHLQPLVITNPSRDASPDEIVALEEAIATSVEARFGIRLTPEVEHIGIEKLEL
ncbi:MAG: UDP-N-acetylmuramate dehydrogenase [Duncaniella sp.]|nr:UDP-N-acetylmuramate dehydrogenase [Duncaniella sp.]